MLARSVLTIPLLVVGVWLTTTISLCAEGAETRDGTRVQPLKLLSGQLQADTLLVCDYNRSSYYRAPRVVYYTRPPVYRCDPRPNPCYYNSVPRAAPLPPPTQVQPRQPEPRQPEPRQPVPPIPPEESTFPYDGGPQNPVPLPQGLPTPRPEAERSVPLDGHPVSIPAPPPRFRYRAYGE